MSIISVNTILPYLLSYSTNETNLINNTSESNLPSTSPTNSPISPTSSPTSSPNNHAQCYALVNDSNIKFLKDSNLNKERDLRHQYPLYLFSFGGSGNTMTRTLLEYTTNIWTGSIYGDQGLFKFGFKGEDRRCPVFDTLVNKAHPEHISSSWSKGLQHDRDLFLLKCLGYRCKNIETSKKCEGSHSNLGKLSYSNMSAIFIVRNPWKAIFALWVFKNGGSDLVKENNHIRHLWIDKWDKEQWTNEIKGYTQKYLKTFDIMERMKEYGYDYIVVKYENLIDLKHPETQKNEMNKMLKYLYSDDGYQRNEEIFNQRMDCLFPDLMEMDYQRMGSMHRKKANETEHVTMDMAYQYLMDEHLDKMCNAWEILKEKAMFYGYSILPGLNCTDSTHVLNQTDTKSLDVLHENHTLH